MRRNEVSFVRSCWLSCPAGIIVTKANKTAGCALAPFVCLFVVTHTKGKEAGALGLLHTLPASLGSSPHASSGPSHHVSISISVMSVTVRCPFSWDDKTQIPVPRAGKFAALALYVAMFGMMECCETLTLRSSFIFARNHRGMR